MSVVNANIASSLEFLHKNTRFFDGDYDRVLFNVFSTMVNRLVNEQGKEQSDVILNDVVNTIPCFIQSLMFDDVFVEACVRNADKLVEFNRNRYREVGNQCAYLVRDLLKGYVECYNVDITDEEVICDVNRILGKQGDDISTQDVCDAIGVVMHDVAVVIINLVNEKTGSFDGKPLLHPKIFGERQWISWQGVKMH